MPDISFDQNGRSLFSTKYHGDFSLSKKKWDGICQEPERHYFRSNGEKVATTLINPDVVLVSSTYDNQFKYYKTFDTIRLNDMIEVPTTDRNRYWAVVIDESTRAICTTYPTNKPRSGKEYKER